MSHTALVLAADRSQTDRLLAAYFAGRAPLTVKAYREDLTDFSAFLLRAGVPLADPADGVGWFLSRGAASANEVALHYRDDLLARGRASSTINRRLAALRALVKVGRLIGLVPWDLTVGCVRPELVRETRGPSPEVVAALLAKLAERRDAIGLRNVALVRLLYDLGLRVGEVCRLDLEDVEPAAPALWVRGKGRRGKDLLSLPAPTMAAVGAYLALRGARPGPLLYSASPRPGREAERLTTRAVQRIVRQAGASIGVKLWPHALRHSAVTQAVERSVALGVSLDEVRQFSRHKHLATLLVYRDRTRDVQGQLAAAVADTVPSARAGTVAD